MPQQTITLWKVVDHNGLDYCIQLTEQSAQEQLVKLQATYSGVLHVERFVVTTDPAETSEVSAFSPAMEVEMWTVDVVREMHGFSLGVFATEKEARLACEKHTSSMEKKIRRVVLSIQQTRTGIRAETAQEEIRRLKEELAILRLKVDSLEEDRVEAWLERDEAKSAAQSITRDLMRCQETLRERTRERDEACSKLRHLSDYLAG